MKNTLRDVTECCNNTHQGAPHTGKRCAKMCCACNMSLKLALRTSVTTSHVTCWYAMHDQSLCWLLSMAVFLGYSWGTFVTDTLSANADSWCFVCGLQLSCFVSCRLISHPCSIAVIIIHYIRDVTKFAFKFDSVRTSNVFSRFKICQILVIEFKPPQVYMIGTTCLHPPATGTTNWTNACCLIVWKYGK